MNDYTRTHAALLALGLLILSFVSGCADLQGALSQTTAWRDNALEIESDLQSELGLLEDQRRSIPDTSPNAGYLDQAIEQASDKIDMLNSAIERVDLVIAEAQHPTDSLTHAANTIAPWIPAPAQGPLVLGAALIATLLRSRNLKNSASSIIQSIEHTMRRDPEFKELFEKHADTIRTIQTPSARKLIDTTIQRSKKQAVLA